MITRRSFLATVSALSAIEVLPLGKSQAWAASQDHNAATSEDLTKFVNLAIGTGGHGHTYPGATVPFGMVQLSPDTFNDEWDWCSGYHYSDTSIMGFSHTHLSGTGCGDLLDFLLMPGTGPVKLVPGTREHPEEGYRSRFSHNDEVAHPGYYSVLLSDYNVRAELSATERAGIHRYTFPQSDSSHFILDLSHAYGLNPDPIIWSQLEVTGKDTIVGGHSTAAWARGRQVFFTMKFSRPFDSVEIYSDGQKLDNTTGQVKGKSVKCVVHYKTAPDEKILVKTGISGVSVEGSQKNLVAEILSWDFEKVRQDAHNAWQRELSKISIETTNSKHREIFYTALYHLMVAPTLFDDVDGQYQGMDGTAHSLAPGAHNYTAYSLWDTYRAAHPLYTLFQSERVPNFVNCLIRMAEESPAGMPVWPLYAKETGTMTGYHSAAVIAESCVKGFKGIDFAKAYPLMKKRAMVDDYRGLGCYRKLGYIPCEKEEESVSKTLEYVYDDWSVAHVARAVGETQDAELLLKRSKNYANVFDKQMNFMRPRLETGEWAEPFDPLAMGHSKKWRDFTESNSWQTTFGIQHDPKGYMALFGSKEAFVQKLDLLFTQSSALPADAPPDIAGLVGQYAHGNEPSHHIVYLYAYAGVPHKTQERVRSLLETMYRAEPDGMAGNEDCGQMSAWFVMSALGFYSVDPVSGNYVFGTPLFDRATVRLADNKHLVLEAKRNSPDDKYIQSVTFNGKEYKKSWFRHADIRNGGKFVFTMGSQPNPSFGSDESEVPPSLTT
jgi:predicted alpha-1,2-mannosidase